MWIVLAFPRSIGACELAVMAPGTYRQAPTSRNYSFQLDRQAPSTKPGSTARCELGAKRTYSVKTLLVAPSHIIGLAWNVPY